ncbi:hypothetical protein BDV40DRAFT_283206, partial [Aspergillus tamarii]
MAWLEKELEAMGPYIHAQSSSNHHSTLTDHPIGDCRVQLQTGGSADKGTAAMNIPQCYEQQSQRNRNRSRFASTFLYSPKTTAILYIPLTPTGGGSRRSRRRPVRPDLVDFVAREEELSAQLQEAKLRRRANQRHRTTKEYKALSKEIDQLQAILQRKQRGCRK